MAHLHRQQEALRRDLPDRQRAEAEKLREKQTQKRETQERALITERARQDIRLTPAQEQAVKDDPQSREAYESGLNLGQLSRPAAADGSRAAPMDTARGAAGDAARRHSLRDCTRTNSMIYLGVVLAIVGFSTDKPISSQYH